MTMFLPFGKYNGKRLGEVPTWYLEWLGQQKWFNEKFPQLAAEAKRILDDDDAPIPATALSRDVLKTWRRSVLKKWHPDRDGGSHAAFVAVSDAVQTLGEMLAERGAA